jgi:membrane protein DedA with SNARE-associated domain
MNHFVEHWGLWVVFGVIFLEVAGLPFIPGETVLITAAALASQGHGNIVAIIVVAIAAAILGALFGYVVGRRWGREALNRWPRFERASRKGIDRSQEFFDRHGGKAVFLGRFVPIVRATLGWMAGLGHMPFWRFLFWNVLGAVAWATTIGLLAYYVGEAVIQAIERDLLYGVLAIAGVAALIFGIHRLQKRAER